MGFRLCGPDDAADAARSTIGVVRSEGVPWPSLLGPVVLDNVVIELFAADTRW
jgi:hypothetical protein